MVTDPAKSTPLFGPGGLGTFSWPGAYGTWWQGDPTLDLVLIYLVQNHPALSPDAAAVSGNTSHAKLTTALPKFVRRTYRALFGMSHPEGVEDTHSIRAEDAGCQAK